jgi:hypothetical protein
VGGDEDSLHLGYFSGSHHLPVQIAIPLFLYP